MDSSTLRETLPEFLVGGLGRGVSLVLGGSSKGVRELVLLSAATWEAFEV